LTQDGARILAVVYDGDLEPIKRLVLNRDADEQTSKASPSFLSSAGRTTKISSTRRQSADRNSTKSKRLLGDTFSSG
jgi:hypothetical protein